MAEMSDAEVFGAAPVQPAVTSTEMSDAVVFGTKPTAAGVMSDADVFGKPQPKGNSVVRGAVSSFLEEQPELLGKALEGISHSAPEWAQPTLRSGSAWLLEKSKSLKPEEYKRQAKDFWSSFGNMDDALTYMGEALGSGLATTAMPLALGGAGAVAGGAVGGLPGAAVGGITGGLLGGSPLNYGEVYKALQDEKVPDKDADKYAQMVTPIMAGLDVAGLALPAARALGLGGVRREVARGVARRVAAGLAGGAVGEGVTEGAQGGVKLGTVSGVTGKDFFTKETLKQIVEDAFGGLLVGGTIGGAVGLKRDQASGEAATTDEVAAAQALMTGGVQGPSGTMVAPPLATTTASGPGPEMQPSTGPLGSMYPSVTSSLSPGLSPGWAPTNEWSMVPAEALATLPQDGGVQTHESGLYTFARIPPPAVRSEDLVPPDIVETMTRKAAEEISSDGLTVPEKPLGFSELLAAQRQEKTGLEPLQQEARTIKMRATGDVARMADIMGAHQYGDLGEMPQVIVKETLQNAVDSIRPLMEKDPNYPGAVDFKIDPTSRTITIHDNGTGMTPDTIMGAFLRVAGSGKEGVRKGGGFGFAKMMYLFGSKSVKLTTARNGEVSTLLTTGPEIKASLAGQGELDTQLRKFTVDDQKMFPQGHGTRLELQIPEAWVDAEENVQRIDMGQYEWQHKGSFKNSPLFDNIDVTFNGKKMPVGKGFPKDEYTPLMNVKFPWGTARLYVSQLPHAYDTYTDNVHVLSTGLIQFSLPLSKNGERYGPKIERTVYIDVQPNVKPEEPNYPFNVTRQGFAKSVDPLFGQLMRHLTAMYKNEETRTQVEDFGEIQFLTFSTGGKVEVTGRKRLKPPPPKKVEVLRTLQPGAQVEVVGGQLTVQGKKVQELTPADIKETAPDLTSLSVPQTEIASDQVLLHDVTLVPATGVPGPVEQIPEGAKVANFEPVAEEMVSMTQLGHSKFGARYYEYLFLLGRIFLAMRDETSKQPGYAGLMEEAVGLSVAAHKPNGNNYYGLSTRMPFSASLLNPFLSEFPGNPKLTAISMLYTMIHELAHHTHRSEDGLEPVARKILMQLETSEDFNFQEVKQQLVNLVSSYHDIVTYMQGAYDAGIVRPGGRSFSDSSNQQGRDGSGVGEADQPSLPGRSGADPDTWVQLSNAAPPGKPGPANVRPSVESTGVDPSFGAAENQRALNSEAEGVRAAQQQPEFDGPRAALKDLFGGSIPTTVKAAGAHADRMNWGYKWLAGLAQLVAANPYFAPLLRYYERIKGMHVDESKLIDGATRIAKDWRSLGLQGENLTAFLDELTRMVYRTEDEINQGVERNPSPDELNAMIAKHKMSGTAVKVFTKVKILTDGFIDLIGQANVEAAQRRFTDPVRLSEKIDQIKATVAGLKSRPYFPFMNFGRHFVRVTNAAGDTVRFETFERKGYRTAVSRQQQSLKEQRELAARRGLGEEVKDGIIPELATPFIGMPGMLLESIKENLQLTQEQLTALEQMQFQSSTLTSFKTRFESKSYVPGYSMDFKRAFSNYFFHGARYYARTRHVWALNEHIKEAHAAGGNKESRIANYMDDHLQNTILDAKGDFGIFKGAIFLWAMGYVPAAAFQNLSQTPMITYPYLAGKFGDIRATRAIVKAMGQLNNFYKRGSYEGQTAFEMRALDYGIKTGRITEAQASDLAGLSQGEGLLRGLGGNRAERFAIHIQEKAAWMFEMAEQFNRRIAYRAGLMLALENPNSKEVQLAVRLHSEEYQSLLLMSGPNGVRFTPAEAKAIITANHVTERTQYIYARYGRPRVFRGRLPGTLFVFKMYMQSTIMLLAHNKSDVLPRFLIMAFLIGGLQAFPGWDDLKELVKGIARWKFGKDFALDREVRNYINQWFDGTVDPDLVLHGLSRRGFGVPALLDAMGSLYTGTPGRGLSATMTDSVTGQKTFNKGRNVPAPVVDMSRQISMGNILPLELGKLVGPAKDANAALGEQTQKASGAVFSVGFNMYKAVMDNHLGADDPKRWERAVPRALASASKMFRSFGEERDRGSSRGPNSSPTVREYDPRDTEHMMELLSIGMGFQTLRTQGRWDNIIAKAEVDKFYDLRRQGLLEQMFEAVKGKDPKEIGDVMELIRKYNTSLPEHAQGRVIPRETIIRSMKSRERELQSREQGIPTQRTKAGTSQHIDKLFPEGVVETRRVR